MQIEYKAEPTAAAFHASDEFIRGLMGPIGSGKSVACVLEVLQRSIMQEPDPSGIRKTRWAIIRNTYPELKSTTIRTFSDWIPEHLCPIKWDAPISGRMKIADIGDGTGVDMEVLFLALDRPQDIKKLLSLELTGGWINEAREISKAVLDGLTGRVGRYPSKRDGGPTYSGVFMDTNPPDDDHWWYKLAEVHKPKGHVFWQQPPALLQVGDDYEPNPDAENVQHQPLGHEYWLRQVYGKNRDWINVYVMGSYGAVMDGKPVWPEYNDNVHCKPVELYRGLPLLLGWDFGLTPAVVICQISPRGQFRILDELVATDMGIRQFTSEIVKPHLALHYQNMSIESVGDPAGSQRSQSTEQTCLQELAAQGIPTKPAKTNEFIARREAVAGYLTRLSDGEPAFQIDPKAKTIRKALMGAYKFERVQVSGEERYKDMPVKNHYSHIADALQYACMHTSMKNVVHLASARPRHITKRNAQGWT